MANPDRQARPDIARTEQSTLNNSFDEVYKVLAVALLGEYNNDLYRLQVDSTGALKTTATLSGDVTAGTEYTEDAAAPADPVGGILQSRRRDTLSASEVSSDGDIITLNATDKGQLHVKIADTQPVSAASLPLPTGAATAANQQTDALTDTQLRATPVPVSGTVSTGLTQPTTPSDTQPISHAALTELAAAINTDKVDVNIVSGNITGFATSAKQDTIIGHVDSIETLIGSTNTKLDTVITNTDTALTDTELRATPVVVDLGVNNDVTVTSGAITETNSAAIKTAVETIDNAISGSEMQVDVVGALPAGTNAIGKLAANSGVDIGDVDVTSSVSGSLDHGSNLDIDTTAEQITSTSFAAKFGVTIKAAADNSGTVYIGNSDVTDGDTAATDGFPLEPGESITLPINNPNLLYAIASVANQKVFWSAV